jgi:hypothetical protein
MRTTTHALAAAVAALLLAGCGAGSAAQEASPTLRGDGSGVPMHLPEGAATTPDNASPQQVAVSALTQVYTWQPAVEPTRGDALARAAAWLGGDLLAAAQAPATDTGLRPDADWVRWAAQQAVVRATVALTGEETTPVGGHVYTATVTQSVLTPAGVTAQKSFPVTATLTQTPNGWRLTAYRA